MNALGAVLCAQQVMPAMPDDAGASAYRNECWCRIRLSLPRHRTLTGTATSTGVGVDCFGFRPDTLDEIRIRRAVNSQTLPGA